VGHLSLSLRPLLEPTALLRGGYDASMLLALRHFTKSLLTLTGMETFLSSPLASLLIVAYALLDNAAHLQQVNTAHGDDVRLLQNGGDTGDEKATSTSLRASMAPFSTSPAAFLATPTAVASIGEALQCLRGVELLHVATTVARHQCLREKFFTHAALPTLSSPASSSLPSDHAGDSCEENTSAQAVLLGVVRKCIRVVGTEMSEEDLFTHRLPRRYPAGVVDEFLMWFASVLFYCYYLMCACYKFQ